MAIFLQTCFTRCYEMICRGYGLNLPEVLNLQSLFKRKMNCDQGQHLILQRQTIQNWTNPSPNNHWLRIEDYFVDWQNSTLIEDLDLIEKILDQSLIDLQSNDMPLVNANFYKTHPLESEFVLRVISRKLYESKRQHPTEDDFKDLCCKSILALKEALNNDRKTRENNLTAPLNSFTYCNYAQSILLRKCAKKLSIHIAIISAVFFFNKIRLDIHTIKHKYI